MTWDWFFSLPGEVKYAAFSGVALTVALVLATPGAVVGYRLFHSQVASGESVRRARTAAFAVGTAMFVCLLPLYLLIVYRLLDLVPRPN